MFSERETQRIITALEAVRDSKIMIPKEMQQIINYISEEIEVQDSYLKLAKEGIDPYASMKIEVDEPEEYSYAQYIEFARLC